MYSFNYNRYNYVEPQEFKTLAEQKDFKFDEPKGFDVPIYELNSFFTEGGQKSVPVIQPDIAKIDA